MVWHCLEWISVSGLLTYLIFCSVIIKYSKCQSGEVRSYLCTGDFCPAKDEYGEPCLDEGGTLKHDKNGSLGEGLYRWDPVQLPVEGNNFRANNTVGHVRMLELEPDNFFKVITRAVQPPIFEIPGFLSDEECDEIINRTKIRGLFNSHVHMDPDSIAHEEKMKELIGHASSPAGKFKNWDDNEDEVITKNEVKKFAAESKYLYLNDEEIDEMIEKLELTEFDDGQVTEKEFLTLKTAAMEQYFIERKKMHPKHRDRYSEQTWLPQGGEADTMMKKLKERYITVLYYLNQPEKGGETAFPAADVEGFNETDFRERRNGDEYNLSKFCHRSALVVPPKKGTAIMWYNHFRDESGWLGDLDWRTLHGGCDILKGEKWIANNWLTAPENGEQHIPSNYYIEDSEK